jgi:hypothetical protein
MAFLLEDVGVDREDVRCAAGCQAALKELSQSVRNA